MLWEAEVRGAYGGTIHHRPADRDFNLHFNLPSTAVEVGPVTTQPWLPCRPG